MAKANKLDLELVEKTPEKPFPAEYAKINPLNKIPSFEGSDGYVLTESIAIAIYSMLPHFLRLYLLPNLMMRYVIIYSYPCLKTIVENIHTLKIHKSAALTFLPPIGEEIYG